MSKTGEWGGNMTIEYLRAKDARRHKTWCVHYFNGKCKWGNCSSSAHCQNYKTHPEENGLIIGDTDSSTKGPFYGEKLIDMRDVYISNQAEYSISLAEEEAMKNKFVKDGDRPAPIVVSCVNGRYLLKDGYLQYYVAKKLGVKQILATMNILKPSTQEDFIRIIGAEFIYKKHYKKVTVIRATEERVWVKDTIGNETELIIACCIKKDLLRLVGIKEYDLKSL